MKLKHTILWALVFVFVVFGNLHGANAASWFLGIGNDGYFGDATGIWDAMIDWNNWGSLPNSNYRLYANQTGSKILNRLDWLSNNVQSGDVAVFYYSGHGAQSTDYSNDEPTDFGYDEVIGKNSAWVTDDMVAEHLRPASDAGATTVAIFDACQSGGMFGGNEDLNQLENAFIMASSREDEMSYASSSMAYSFFTSELINGISGNAPADLDSNGSIYANEWFTYAKNNTPSIQHPQFYSSLDSIHNKALFTTPEPAGVVLFLMGVPALLAARRRSRKKIT